MSENGLRVFRKPLWVESMCQKKGKGLLLAALFLIGAVGFGQGFSTETGQVRVESSASGLNCGKGCNKVGRDTFFPVNSGRVNARQCGKNGSSEGGASDGTAGLALAPKGQAMISEGGKQHADKSYKCDGYCGLYLTLPLWIYIYWMVLFPPRPTMEHNAELSRERRRREAPT